LTNTSYPVARLFSGLRALSGRAIGLEARLSLAVAGALLAVIAAIVVAIMLLCGGHFLYSADDPYISLSLGWHIGHGHYGINDGEVSSPSSSILYPFVLAGFAWTALQPWVPLALNALAAAGTAALFAIILCGTGIITRRNQLMPAAIFVVSLCLAINLVGLVFMGLEHPLHALTSVAVVFGLARALEGKRTPPWLVAAIVLAPLWRFEGLALSALAIFALALVGRWRAAGAALAGIAVTVGAYAIAMHAMGLPLLPSSVMVKSYLFEPDGAGAPPLGLLQSVLDNLRLTLPARYIVLLIVVVALHPPLRALGVLSRDASDRLGLWHEWIFAAVVTGALLAHLLFGARGWFSRYEDYAVALGAAGAIILWHRAIKELLMPGRPLILAVGCIALFAVDPYYIRTTISTPLISRSIYERQYQMHRFAVDFYRAPVAVNDLGWVGYRNPNYVLDLWGLGSESARRARLVTHEPGWMDRLAQAHHVGVAMIYANWFEQDIPASWQPLAMLEPADSGSGASVGEDKITFFATSAAAVPDAQAALQRFAAAIGPAARLTLLAEDPPAH
jgi:hypothetical protein